MFRILPVLLFTACADQSIDLGKGSDPDARLVADLYTWPCEEQATDGSVVDAWEGVYAYDLTLEYAPDALVDRGLPAEGCVAGLDLFADNAGHGGTDIPDVSEPGWSNGSFAGVLEHQAPGFYFTSVFDNARTCLETQDLLGEGTLVSDAGPFSGSRTPAPGTYEGVTVSGEVDSDSGLTFGATATAEWDAEEWENAWVQIRREDAGALVESVTCNASGQNSFTVDGDVWGLMSSGIETDVTNLYVSVENVGETSADDGQTILTATRAMHVAVVVD